MQKRILNMIIISALLCVLLPKWILVAEKSHISFLCRGTDVHFDLSSREPPEIAPGSFLRLQSKTHGKKTSNKCHGIIRPPHPCGISPHNTYMFTFVDIPIILEKACRLVVGGSYDRYNHQL